MKKVTVKEAARSKVQKAVLSGKLIKTPCIKCGDSLSEGHHTDYSKPLEVLWLCRKHHMEMHNSLRGHGHQYVRMTLWLLPSHVSKLEKIKRKTRKSASEVIRQAVEAL